LIFMDSEADHENKDDWRMIAEEKIKNLKK
jgi:hypothetical protein